MSSTTFSIGSLMSFFSLYNSESIGYPQCSPLYRPHIAYPEYMFEDLSPEPNTVYDSFRELMALSGLDSENIGSAQWNPLRQFINPGNRVLIKPNLVMHKNESGCGNECLYTHPSLIAAVIDYVAIALQGRGSIVVADAPVQSCDFDCLTKESGLDRLVAYYQSQRLNIELLDLRGLKSTNTSLGLVQVIDEQVKGRVVDLGEKSSFADLSEDRLNRLRITCYDPAELKKHHNTTKHEYYVSDQLLQSDVVINMPKLKTHRKAGMTCALKNMVGVNVRKEYLPHHSIGSSYEGFDEYERKSFLKRLAAFLLDYQNMLMSSSHKLSSKALSIICRLLDRVGATMSKDDFSEGSWFGNDTIWRTVLDLNKIVFFANEQGIIQNDNQRRMLVITDGIVAGEKEGPLLPEPKKMGLIGLSDNPIANDVAFSRLAGSDPAFLPTVYQALENEHVFFKEPVSECNCLSNAEEFNHVGIKNLNEESILYLTPSSGWSRHFLRFKSSSDLSGK